MLHGVAHPERPTRVTVTEIDGEAVTVQMGDESSRELRVGQLSWQRHYSRVEALEDLGTEQVKNTKTRKSPYALPCLEDCPVFNLSSRIEFRGSFRTSTSASPAARQPRRQWVVGACRSRH